MQFFVRVGKLVPFFVAALLFGGLGARLLGPAPVEVYTGSSPATPHGKVGATTAITTKMMGAEFVPNASSPCAPGTLCVYRDANGHLQAHNADNSLNQLAPAIPPSVFSSTSPLGTLSITTQMDGPDTLSDYGERYVHGVDATGTNRGPFNMVWNEFPETSADYPSYVDNTFNLGWNCGGGGSYQSGQPSMCLALEQFFVPTVGVHQMEGHWIYNSPNGTQYRPISIEGHLDPDGTTGFSRMLMYSSQTFIGSGASAGDLNAHTQISLSNTTTRVNSPDGTQLLTLDNVGENVVLQSTDGVHNAQLVLSPGNGGEAHLQGGLVRLADSSGNVNFENDSATTSIADNAGDARIILNSSEIQFDVAGLPYMVLQANQFDLASIFQLLTRNAIGDGASPMGTALGVLLRNDTAATSGTPVQMSPCSVWTGHVWNTSAGGSSKDTSFSLCVDSVSGAQEIGRMVLGYSNDQGNYIAVGRLERDSNSNFGADGHFGAQGFQFDDASANGGGGFGTCDATHNRGMVRTVYGGAGIADLTKQCLKSHTDTYSWVQIATGG